MRLQKAWTIVLAAAMLLPLARAGDEANPDVTDGPSSRIADGSLDFLAAWMESHPTGLAFTVKVREATDTLAPDHAWAVAFEMGGVRHILILATDSEGALHGCVCLAGKLGKPAASLPDDLRDVAFHPGKPATFSALVPWDAIPGLRPGAVLQNVGAGSLTYDEAARSWNDYDTNEAIDGYAVQHALLPPAVARAMPYVAGGIALVAAGVGIGLLAARRRRPSPQEASVTLPIQEPASAPVAGRMSLKPPP